MLPIVITGVLAAGAGVVGASKLADDRLGEEAEHRAQGHLVALETVMNVSDHAGIRRATTAVGAGRDVDLVFVAAGNPAKVLAASNTSMIGLPISMLDEEVLALMEAVRGPAASSPSHAVREGDSLFMSGRLKVRETGRDGIDLSNAVGLIKLDLSAVAEQVGEDAFALTVGEIAAIVALAAVAIFLIRRHVLRPLRSIAKSLDSGEDPGSRGTGSWSSEMEDLASTLYQALEARAESEARLAEVNRRLELSNEGLERLVESKDHFLASVSHEMRTPLTAIVGFAEHLKEVDEGLTAADRTEIVETISSEGTDVMNLIEDLMTAARADIGRLDMASVRVDLAGQSRQVIQAMAWQLPNVRFSGDPSPVVGDPSRVRQIVRNLLTNAIRYGGPDVTVEVAGDTQCGLVRVSDDGDGVRAAEAELIFEPYERANGSVRVADSVGIGLPLSRRLARLMGGDLTYRRLAGRSVFELSLPALVADSRAALDASSSERLAPHA